jgi:hypothetical protein
MICPVPRPRPAALAHWRATTSPIALASAVSDQGDGGDRLGDRINDPELAQASEQGQPKQQSTNQLFKKILTEKFNTSELVMSVGTMIILTTTVLT